MRERIATPPATADVRAAARFAAALLGAVLVAQAAAGVDSDEAAPHVIDQTNTFRRAEGLEPLARDAALSSAARGFARYMAKTGKYGHTADGRQPVERATAEGYDACIVAENIGYQYRSTGFASAEALAGALVEGWKESPEHRKNMLDPALREIGVGIAQGEGGRYFGVQLFGRPKSAAIRFEVRNAADRSVEYQAGGRDYALSPRERRTHLVCRSVELKVARPGPAEAYRVQVSGGARYVVRDDGVVEE